MAVAKVTGQAVDSAAREAVRLADVDPSRAIPVAALAARQAGRERDVAAAAVAEQAWGHALLQVGEVDQAMAHLRRSIGHGVRSGRLDLAAESRMKLAFALVQRGRPRPALHEIDLAVQALGGVAGAKARAQRAVILYHVGRLDDAFVDYQAAVQVLRRGDDRLALQRVILNRGVLQAERYEFDAAVRDLTEGEALARELGRGLAVGIIAENLGFVAGQRGDVPAALTYLDRAEEIIGRHGGQVAPVLQDRAELLLSVGLVTEAREAAEQAVVVFRRERRGLKVPETLLLLAHAALLDRDWAAAGEHARQALRAFTHQGRAQWAALARLAGLRATLAAGKSSRVSTGTITAMVNALAANGRPLAAVQARLDAARLALRRGQVDAAMEHLVVAQRARARGPAALRAHGWYAAALVRRHTGDDRGAARAARAGLRVLDEHHAALGASDLRAYSATYRTDLAELGLRGALRDGRPAGVFEWAERGRASRLVHRLVLPPADPELAELLPRLRSTTRELELAAGQGQPTGRLRHRQVELERRVRHRSRVLRADVTGRPPDPVTPRELHPLLGERALVEFVRLDGSLLALTLVGGRVRLHPLGDEAVPAGLLDRVPFALRQLCRADGLDRSRARAESLLRNAMAGLDAVLLGPLRELGDRPLVVVPTGVLHSVPWSILPSCVGRPVAVSPSATVWHAAAARAGSRTGGRVAVACGPGLAGAREEALAVAAVHGEVALVDTAATVDAVLAALGTADIVHLAAHGRLSPDNPLFSAVRLDDGPLMAHDVQRLARVPGTVLLAACDVGRSAVVAGHELLGLSATFLERGTTALIAPVVPVPDAETTPLMVAVHQRLAAGAPPAVALADAQRRVAADGPASTAAAAAFVCVGTG